MPTKTPSDLTKVFEEYHKERYPAVMESYNNSKQFAKIFDAGIQGAIVNYLSTHMPTWLWRQVVCCFDRVDFVRHWRGSVSVSTLGDQVLLLEMRDFQNGS
jgi:hypothetical protein